jgi:hypothetical protein
MCRSGGGELNRNLAEEAKEKERNGIGQKHDGKAA